MTTDQYIAKINRVIEAFENTQPIVEAVFDTVRSQAVRIFEKGIDGNGAAIGTYSKNEIYVNPANSPRSFPLKGKGQGDRKTVGTFDIATRKANRTDVKEGNQERRTAYFEDYGAFKSAIGRGSKVNLLLFGHLQSAFLNGVSPAIKKDKSIEVTVSIRPSITNPEGKIKGILEKYPEAFRLSKGEKETVVKRFGEIFTDIIKK